MVVLDAMPPIAEDAPPVVSKLKSLLEASSGGRKVISILGDMLEGADVVREGEDETVVFCCCPLIVNQQNAVESDVCIYMSRSG